MRRRKRAAGVIGWADRLDNKERLGRGIEKRAELATALLLFVMCNLIYILFWWVPEFLQLCGEYNNSSKQHSNKTMRN